MEKIFNPKTRYWVKVDGKAGRSVLKKYIKAAIKPGIGGGRRNLLRNTFEEELGAENARRERENNSMEFKNSENSLNHL